MKSFKTLGNLVVFFFILCTFSGQSIAGKNDKGKGKVTTLVHDLTQSSDESDSGSDSDSDSGSETEPEECSSSDETEESEADSDYEDEGKAGPSTVTGKRKSSRIPENTVTPECKRSRPFSKIIELRRDVKKALGSDEGFQFLNREYYYFPGVTRSYKASEAEEFAKLCIGTPYGNPSIFPNVLGRHVGAHRDFHSEQRALVIIYNLLKNKGFLLSDYHVESDVSAHRALQKDRFAITYRAVMGKPATSSKKKVLIFGLSPEMKAKLEKEMNEFPLIETSYRLSIPKDLLEDGGKIFQVVYEKLEQENKLNDLKAHFEQPDFSLALLKKWIEDNSNTPAHPLPYEGAQVDHILPKAKGGSNDIRNAAVIAGPMNRTKSDHFTGHLFEVYSDCRDLDAVQNYRPGEKVQKRLF